MTGIVLLMGLVSAGYFFVEYVAPRLEANDPAGRRGLVGLSICAILCLVGVGMFAEIAATTPRCSIRGCNEIVDVDGDLCRNCRREQEKRQAEYKRKSTNASTSASTKTSTSSSKTSTSSKSRKTGSSSGYMHDPDDYDSPEDFADDAYGYDFDDWDDAYDYWENY